LQPWLGSRPKNKPNQALLYVTTVSLASTIFFHSPEQAASCLSDQVGRGQLLLPRLPSPLFQQRFGLLEVSGVKAFGEPAVDGGQQLVGCGLFALVPPQARQAHGGAQL
jgi:hypothetical protein